MYRVDVELAKREHRIDCVLSNRRHIMHDVVIIEQVPPSLVKPGCIPYEMHAYLNLSGIMTQICPS